MTDNDLKDAAATAVLHQIVALAPKVNADGLRALSEAWANLADPSRSSTTVQAGR